MRIIGLRPLRPVRRAARPPEGSEAMERLLARVEELAAELEDMSGRVRALEAENMELRAHSLRLAEITDVVQELLLPLAEQDQQRLEEALARWRDVI